MQRSVLPLFLLAGAGLAQATIPGVYVGGGAGLSSLESHFGSFKNQDVRRFGGRIFLGYNFTDYLGLETNYTVFEKTKYLDINNPYSNNSEYALSNLSLVGKVYLPLGDAPFNAYGLLGAARAYGKLDRSYSSHYVVSNSYNEFVPTAGLGLNYDISQRFTAGLELSGFGHRKAADNFGIPNTALATLNFSYRM